MGWRCYVAVVGKIEEYEIASRGLYEQGRMFVGDNGYDALCADHVLDECDDDVCNEK